MRARRFLPGLLPLATGLVIGAAVAVGPGLVQWVFEKISNKGTEETERPKQPETGNKADEQSTVAPGELAEATDINCGPDPEPWTCFITPPFFWHALSELCTYSGALCPLNPFDGSKGQVVSWSYTSLFQTTIAIVSEHDPRQVVLVTLLRGPSPCASVVINVLVCCFTQPSAACTEVHNAAAVAEQSQDTAHKKKKHKKNRKKLNKKQRLAKKRAAEASLASSATPVPAAVAHVPTETDVACELPAEQAATPVADASEQAGCSDVCSKDDSLITCSTPVASSPACSRRCSETGSACDTEEACADSMTTNSLAEQATETEGTSNHGSEDQVLGLVFTPKPESEPTVSTGPSRGGTGASSTPLSDSPASSLGRVSDSAALSDSALSVPSRPASPPQNLVQETEAQKLFEPTAIPSGAGCEETSSTSLILTDSAASLPSRVLDSVALSNSALSVYPTPASSVQYSVPETTVQQEQTFNLALPFEQLDMTYLITHGGFHVLHQLGQGSWGSVDACYFPGGWGGQTVALKRCNILTADGERTYNNEVFINEHVAMCGGHENVLCALAWGTELGFVPSPEPSPESSEQPSAAPVIGPVVGHLVTPLMQRDLASFCMQYGSDRPIELLVKYLVDVGRGLEFLHSIGMTHNDLKPDNVFITLDGASAKVADLGMSYPSFSDVPRVHPGGALRFQAYEVIRLSVPQPEGVPPLTGHYDNRADMCGYAILTQWALTGGYHVTSRGRHMVVPESHPNIMAILDEGLMKGTMIHTPHPDMPPALKDVLARAMSYKPDDRPTLVEIMTALEQSVPELLAVQQKRLYEEEMARQQQVLQQQSMAVQLDMAVQQQVLVPPSMN